VGLYGLLKGDPYKRTYKEAGATAARLEQAMAHSVMRRLGGELDPMARAELQRALESERSTQQATERQIERGITRRGLRGSGLFDASQMRTRREFIQRQAALRAGVETRSRAAAEGAAMGIAQQQRNVETQFRTLALARQQMYLNLIGAGAKLYQSNQEFEQFSKLLGEEQPIVPRYGEPEWLTPPRRDIYRQG